MLVLFVRPTGDFMYFHFRGYSCTICTRLGLRCVDRHFIAAAKSPQMADTMKPSSLGKLLDEKVRVHCRIKPTAKTDVNPMDAAYQYSCADSSCCVCFSYVSKNTLTLAHNMILIHRRNSHGYRNGHKKNESRMQLHINYLTRSHPEDCL